MMLGIRMLTCASEVSIAPVGMGVMDFFMTTVYHTLAQVRFMWYTAGTETSRPKESTMMTTHFNPGDIVRSSDKRDTAGSEFEIIETDITTKNGMASKVRATDSEIELYRLDTHLTLTAVGNKI